MRQTRNEFPFFPKIEEDRNKRQKGTSMNFSINQLFSQTSSMVTPFATNFFPALSDAVKVGLGDSSSPFMNLGSLHPGLGAALFGLSHAAPLLQRLLDTLPNPDRMGQDAGPRVGGSRSGGADPQAEIQRILSSNLSLEEKIILIAGLVSDSIGGQLEDLLQQQGKMAQNMNQANASGGKGAQFQNVENQIQLLMQRLNRMQTLASNLLQAVHTTQRTVLSNIRV